MIPALIRAATRLDRDDLLDLWVEAWTAAMPAIDFQARRAWFADRLGELEAEGATTRVSATPDRRLSGFVSVNPHTRYLDQMAIRPAHRGSGLADALMAEAKRLSPGGLVLHVNQDNPRAVRFYERQGFGRLSAGLNPRSGLPTWQMGWAG